MSCKTRAKSVPYQSFDEVAEDQLGWWLANDFSPCSAWDAIGGSTLKLVVTWPEVNWLLRHRMREMSIYGE